MSIHSELLGDNVHQPKGAHLAEKGQVMMASGVGTTSWVDLFLETIIPQLVIASLVTEQTSIEEITYTPFTLTDNTAVSEIPTSVEPLNEGVTDKDSLTNENFAAVVKAVNSINTSLEANTSRIDGDIKLLAVKLNNLIAALQATNIIKEG